MSPAQNLIRHLEDNSLNVLTEVSADVRATGGPTLQAVSDEDLQLALYTCLLKIIDILRDKASVVGEKPADIKTLYVDSLKNVMDYIDGQSSYTTGHTRAVVEHVVKMGSLLGLHDEAIDDLETAAWIHNIGLLNQSQRLAALPRTLTQDELKNARNHTLLGAEMIRPIEFLAHLVPIVRYHHNRFDGNNSAHEPSGDGLPLGARMICLADAYQAMLEPRAYRQAFTRQDAINEILKGIGTQFDPQLVPLVHELSS